MFARSLLLALICCTFSIHMPSIKALEPFNPLENAYKLTKEQMELVKTHGITAIATLKNNTLEMRHFIKGTNTEICPTKIVPDTTLHLQEANDLLSNRVTKITAATTCFAFLEGYNHSSLGFAALIAFGIEATVLNSISPIIKEMTSTKTFHVTEIDGKMNITASDSSPKIVYGDFTLKRPAIAAACIVGAFAAGAFIEGLKNK